ncbi:MAG: class I SAM-dependent methyltransferase [Bacteroidota bacterium]
MDQSYIHGYSDYEQKRLFEQGRTTAGFLHQHFDCSSVNHLLELGCGVGAQTSVLLEKYPHLKITGIDLSEEQLEQARKNLSDFGIDPSRYELRQGNLMALDLSDHSPYDAGLFCWVLEHLPDPQQALREAKRVLGPGSRLFINETFNSNLNILPRHPDIEQYWSWIMESSLAAGTWPDIGATIPNDLYDLGFVDIQVLPNLVFHAKQDIPTKHDWFLFWIEVMRSYYPVVLKAHPESKEVWDRVVHAMQDYGSDPASIFTYTLLQTVARTPF